MGCGGLEGRGGLGRPRAARGRCESCPEPPGLEPRPADWLGPTGSAGLAGLPALAGTGLRFRADSTRRLAGARGQSEASPGLWAELGEMNGAVTG